MPDIDWKMLRAKAHEVMSRAYAPYSGFPVGAAAVAFGTALAIPDGAHTHNLRSAPALAGSDSRRRGGDNDVVRNHRPGCPQGVLDPIGGRNSLDRPRSSGDERAG